MSENIEYLEKDELKELKEQLADLIGEVDSSNPIECLSLATSLVNMGSSFMMEINSKLIPQVYSKEEINSFININELIKQKASEGKINIPEEK